MIGLKIFISASCRWLCIWDLKSSQIHCCDGSSESKQISCNGWSYCGCCLLSVSDRSVPVRLFPPIRLLLSSLVLTPIFHLHAVPHYSYLIHILAPWEDIEGLWHTNTVMDATCVHQFHAHEQSGLLAAAKNNNYVKVELLMFND